MKLTKRKLTFGALVDLITYAVFWFGILNFIMIGLTAYSTTISPFLSSKVPWFNLFWFIIILGLITLGLMALEFFIIYPARQKFRNDWEYSHESPIRRDLDKIKEKLGIENDS